MGDAGTNSFFEPSGPSELLPLSVLRRGPPDRPDLSGLSSSAEELITAVGFQSRNADSRWHLEAL